MTTLTTTVCTMHTPFMSAISTVFGMNIDEQFTFCTECEQNIERWADSSDPYSGWSKWKVSN